MLKKEVFELPPGVLGDIDRNDPTLSSARLLLASGAHRRPAQYHLRYRSPASWRGGNATSGSISRFTTQSWPAPGRNLTTLPLTPGRKWAHSHANDTRAASSSITTTSKSAEAERATRTALRDSLTRAIYEGAFSFDRIGIRADILTRTRNRRFDLLEVKSTLDVKPEHEWDLAIQFHVLKGAGIPIRWARLMHLNRDYVYPGGAYDLKRLFTFTNLTRLVRKRRREVVVAIGDANGTRREISARISVGSQCSAPYVKISFYDHCHEDQPEHSIDDVPRLGARL